MKKKPQSIRVEIALKCFNNYKVPSLAGSEPEGFPVGVPNGVFKEPQHIFDEPTFIASIGELLACLKCKKRL